MINAPAVSCCLIPSTPSGAASGRESPFHVSRGGHAARMSRADMRGGEKDGPLLSGDCAFHGTGGELRQEVISNIVVDFFGFSFRNMTRHSAIFHKHIGIIELIANFFGHAVCDGFFLTAARVDNF